MVQYESQIEPRIAPPGAFRIEQHRAVGTDQAQKYVLTLTASNTVAYKSVTLGPAVDGKRIVRSGLLAGEKIIVNGMERIRPGMAVTPQEQVAGAATVAIAKR